MEMQFAARQIVGLFLSLVKIDRVGGRTVKGDE